MHYLLCPDSFQCILPHVSPEAKICWKCVTRRTCWKGTCWNKSTVGDCVRKAQEAEVPDVLHGVLYVLRDLPIQGPYTCSLVSMGWKGPQRGLSHIRGLTQKPLKTGNLQHRRKESSGAKLETTCNLCGTRSPHHL